MEKVKLFIAIPLPKEFVEVVGSVKTLNSAVVNVKWVPLQNYHITQYFVGKVFPASIPEIIKLSERVLYDAGKFRLLTEQFSLEGERKRPSMIWLKFYRENAFSKLHNNLHLAVKSITEQETKFFNPIPHITVARLRKSNATATFKLPENTEQINKLDVTTFELWQSDSTDAGIQYKNLHQF